LLPFVFGVENLDSLSSAIVLEKGVSLIGIVVLIPLFSPEQDKNISELAESKYTSMACIYLIRLFLSISIIMLLVSSFVMFMQYNKCDFNIIKYIFGTFSSALFLGALGLLVYSITNNVIVGYLISIFYYIINFVGADKLNNFYLFSMSKNSFKEKYYLFIAEIVMITISLLYKFVLQKVR